MVGAYFNKTLSDSARSQSEDDSYPSGLDSSIRDRSHGMVKTTETTRGSFIKTDGYKERIQYHEKRQETQTKRQKYQTQPTALSLQSDLNLDAYISPTTGLNDVDMPPRLKLITMSQGETAWLKPDLLSESSGHLSAFEENSQISTSDSQLKFPQSIVSNNEDDTMNSSQQSYTKKDSLSSNYKSSSNKTESFENRYGLSSSQSSNIAYVNTNVSPSTVNITKSTKSSSVKIDDSPPSYHGVSSVRERNGYVDSNVFVNKNSSDEDGYSGNNISENYADEEYDESEEESKTRSSPMKSKNSASTGLPISNSNSNCYTQVSSSVNESELRMFGVSTESELIHSKHHSNDMSIDKVARVNSPLISHSFGKIKQFDDNTTTEGKRDFSKASRLRFPSNTGGYWIPHVKPLAEFMDCKFEASKSNFTEKDKEFIRQIDSILICGFCYKGLHIMMLGFQFLMVSLFVTVTALYSVEELPQEVELIHLLFFNLVVFFVLFAVNSCASREVRVNGQYRVISYIRIYWHLLRKNIDKSFGERYLFVDDWYGDDKYKFVRSKLREISLFGSPSSVDISKHFYDDI